MNATENGPSNGDTRGALFAEVAELKEQRNTLQTALANCRRENRQLRDELARLKARLEGDG